MKHSIALIVGLFVLAGGGCASKPAPPSQAIQSAVQSRLNAYSVAWFAGDDAGVTESFAGRTGEEREFAQSLGRLAMTQHLLLREQHHVPEPIAVTVQMSDTQPMISLNRPWQHYAAAAARKPHSILQAKGEEGVTVEMIQSGDFTLQVVPVDGRWLIDPHSWANQRPLMALTDSIRRQNVLTVNAADAIRAKDWKRLQGVLQQMHQQQMVDRISDSSSMPMN